MKGEAALRDMAEYAPDKRAPDMYLTPGPSGMTECIDVTIVGFMLTSDKLAKKPTPGWGVKIVEKTKWDKYGPWCQSEGNKFHAVGIEVFGRLGNQAATWFHQMAHAVAQDRGVEGE